MKKLSCTELGGGNCPFVATGETNEEVKGKMMVHADSVHPDKTANMTDDQKMEMDKMMDDRIKDE